MGWHAAQDEAASQDDEAPARHKAHALVDWSLDASHHRTPKAAQTGHTRRQSRCIEHWRLSDYKLGVRSVNGDEAAGLIFAAVMAVVLLIAVAFGLGSI